MLLTDGDLEWRQSESHRWPCGEEVAIPQQEEVGAERLLGSSSGDPGKRCLCLIELVMILIVTDGFMRVRMELNSPKSDYEGSAFVLLCAQSLNGVDLAEAALIQISIAGSYLGASTILYLVPIPVGRRLPPQHA